MTGRWLIAALLAVQAACAVFFVSDIVASVLGLQSAPLSWQTRELLEIGAALGLVLGLGLGAVLLLRARGEAQAARESLRRAQGAFRDLIDERFTAWGLTPAERDVALFAVKGLSTADIARLRNTSEGTVKAQTAAIYRKAGVSGRAQLVALFIEDLIDLPPAPAAPDQASSA
ncbi:MAG: response regulator transcription factor [Gemmobacter sp.]